MDNFNNLTQGVPQSEDLINDGWTDIIGKLANRVMSDPDMSLEGIGVMGCIFARVVPR